MKKSLISKIPLNMGKTFLLMGLIGLMIIKNSEAQSMQPGVSFQIFYDELLPYGDWVQDPVHGYVWVPFAESNFQPYASNGHWVMTPYGNTWVSNYDWGWAPFHYGRWYFDDYLGWAWVPGYEWGPAWVNWRTGAGYYGWAPLRPGIHLHIAVNIPSHHWVFVPRHRLISRNIYNYYIPRRNVYKVYNQTTIINNTYVTNNRTYVAGPPRREIERVTRRSVPVYQVNNSPRPGRAAVGRNSLEVYRPEVRQASNNSRNTQPRPSRVVTAREHKEKISNRGSLSAAPTRTTPSNARISPRREMENPSPRNSASRAGTGLNNNRVQPRENTQRTVSPTRQSNAPMQQSRINSPRERTEQAPATQKQSTVRQRTTQAPAQVRTGSQDASRSRSVQPSRSTNQVRSQSAPKYKSEQSVRSNNQVRSQGAPRSNSTTVSPSRSRQSSSGTASGRNTQRRSSSRGNN